MSRGHAATVYNSFHGTRPWLLPSARIGFERFLMDILGQLDGVLSPESLPV